MLHFLLCLPTSVIPLPPREVSESLGSSHQELGFSHQGFFYPLFFAFRAFSSHTKYKEHLGSLLGQLHQELTLYMTFLLRTDQVHMDFLQSPAALGAVAPFQCTFSSKYYKSFDSLALPRHISKGICNFHILNINSHMFPGIPVLWDTLEWEWGARAAAVPTGPVLHPRCSAKSCLRVFLLEQQKDSGSERYVLPAISSRPLGLTEKQKKLSEKCHPSSTLPHCSESSVGWWKGSQVPLSHQDWPSRDQGSHGFVQVSLGTQTETSPNPGAAAPSQKWPFPNSNQSLWGFIPWPPAFR